MTRKHKQETEEQARERLKKTAQDDREARDHQDEALDAMVRKSLKLHGP